MSIRPLKLLCHTAILSLLLLLPAQIRAQATKPPDPTTLKVSGTLSGAQIFAMTCAACHQVNGAGLPSQFPPIASSEYVTGNAQRLIHIVLRGLTGEVEVEGEMFKGDMPGWAPALSDAQVASVLTYIRKAFGNNASAITTEQVASVRAASASRVKPYTAVDLAKLPP